MRALPILPLLLAMPMPAQDPPALRFLTRIDGGLGGVLVFADGSNREFHIEARPVRAVLTDQRMPTQGRPIAAGSADEQRILAALEAWLTATFSPEQQREWLAKDVLPSPRTQEEDWASREGELLRTVRYYTEVTRPEVTKVFAGRGTVTLSLQLRLGTSPARQLLWRQFGEEPFARMHLGTDTEALVPGSREEGKLLLALGNWLSARLGSPDAVWQPAPAALAEEAGLVLRAYRSYLEATSPRLGETGHFMDGPGSVAGSVYFELWDAQRRPRFARIDYAANTGTPGRLRDGSARDAPLLEPGSARETELLRMLDRTAELRRRNLGAAAEQDQQLRTLEGELRKYRDQFHKNDAGR